uniref:TctD transcriptional regulator n=1 Tax=Polysiphonia sertularioides TaxID=945028 RepID=A0A1Z1M9C2_9FLOR|nr:hypothetical protein [Polysiphonia sertularioides]ARW62576.1 hypothetical protein [Polysiphonia sertularioides]
MKKILLVDDDIKMCDVLSEYLVTRNFSVHCAYSIRSALSIIKKQNPDLVISDIMMNDLTGYDFIKLLNLSDYFMNIPVVFLTAKGMTNDRIKGYNLGCYAYLTKPFDPEELVAILNSILNHLEMPFTSNLLSVGKNLSKHYENSKNLNLTKREKSILNLLSKGYMNKEIALSLNTGQRNVEKYVTRLLNKANVRNRIELIDYFFN